MEKSQSESGGHRGKKVGEMGVHEEDALSSSPFTYFLFHTPPRRRPSSSL